MSRNRADGRDEGIKTQKGDRQIERGQKKRGYAQSRIDRGGGSKVVGLAFFVEIKVATTLRCRLRWRLRRRPWLMVW